jgi:molybdopterin-guanine dinucleotide biosynthesis protein A
MRNDGGQRHAAKTALGGFVLAGGESTRMGRDKALLELGGEPLLVRTARLAGTVVGKQAVVIGPAELYRNLKLAVVEDDWPGAGPLGGIATALRVSQAEWNLVVACDLPYLTQPWLEFLVARARQSRADAVLPINFNGAEPLCAMYHKNCEFALRSALENGIRKVTEGLARVRLERIEPEEWREFDADGSLFKNMNSPADYEEAKRRWA